MTGDQAVNLESPGGSEWVHDKYDESDSRRAPRRDYQSGPSSRYGFQRSRSRPTVTVSNLAYRSDSRGSKIRVDNIHYELTQEDLEVSYSRIHCILNTKSLTDSWPRPGPLFQNRSSCETRHEVRPCGAFRGDCFRHIRICQRCRGGYSRVRWRKRCRYAQIRTTHEL